MNGYVTIPQHLLQDTTRLFQYFELSIAYIQTLKLKSTSKKK
ncbi:hypothetical protein N9811_03770 [Bacteroidia bacterium]|jgi:hypothetical protein|nr:hypothetical protein [Bacteroidia bacterium]